MIKTDFMLESSARAHSLAITRSKKKQKKTGRLMSTFNLVHTERKRERDAELTMMLLIIYEIFPPFYLIKRYTVTT